MSACFVWVSHPEGFDPWPNQSSREELGRWVPFKAERAQGWRHPSGRVSALLWETHVESARGAYFAEGGRGEALSFTGWWREPDEAPQRLSSASVALHALLGRRLSTQGARGYERGLADFGPSGGWEQASEPQVSGEAEQLTEALDALHLSPGQFAFALAGPQGALHAVNGAFCGSPLYFASARLEREGRQAQVTIVSNRASLISALLEGGRPATPRAEVLGWLLSRRERPLGEDEVSYPRVSRLMAGQRLSAYEGELSRHTVPLPEPRSASEDALYQGLLWRVSALRRYPEVPLTMALTGGFDSRLVLGGLIATGLAERVERYYINAKPQHADARSAQRLADHYQLPFEIDPPGRGQDPQEPLIERLRRHNHLTEHMMSAWDILVSGSPSALLPSRALMPGHYGELYRGHAYPVVSRSWALVRGLYLSGPFLNRHGLLQPELVERYRGLSARWLDEERASGGPAELAFDRLHRVTRMEGWISQSHAVESLGYPSFALLPCVTTRAHYEASSLQTRQRPSVHHALMRRVDDELWRLPLASPWPRALYRAESRAPEPPVSGEGAGLGYQCTLWSEQGAQLSEWLLSTPAESELWRVIRRERLIAKLSQVERSLDPQKVRALMCVCGLKVSLSEPLSPVQFRRS